MIPSMHISYDVYSKQKAQVKWPTGARWRSPCREILEGGRYPQRQPRAQHMSRLHPSRR